MKTKRLFNDDDTWTNEALSLDDRTSSACKKIFADMVAEGFSIREISHVMQFSIVDLELCASLDKMSKKPVQSDFEQGACDGDIAQLQTTCI